MRREEVRKTESSRLGRAKLNTKGRQRAAEPVAEVVKPVVAAKPALKKKSIFGKD
tara:strand:+ start:589 stop:753 length:165 start_codon:yes stop_codon:yes gene_type:complete